LLPGALLLVKLSFTDKQKTHHSKAIEEKFVRLCILGSLYYYFFNRIELYDWEIIGEN